MNKDEDKKKYKLLSLLASAGSVVALLLTEKFVGTMKFFDGWTILMALIFAAAAVIAFLSRKKNEE